MPTVHKWQYLEYIIEEIDGQDTITIYGYDSAENPEHPHVTIPAEIEHEGVGLPVRRIGVAEPNPDTFEGAPFTQAGLEGVSIPEGVEAIGQIAFAGNQISGKLVIPNSTTIIELSGFSENEITEVLFGSGIIDIEQYAFLNNEEITRIIIPDDVNLGIDVFIDSPGNFDYYYDNIFEKEAGTYEWDKEEEKWERTGDYEPPEPPEPEEDIKTGAGYGGVRVGYRSLFGY